MVSVCRALSEPGGNLPPPDCAGGGAVSGGVKSVQPPTWITIIHTCTVSGMVACSTDVLGQGAGAAWEAAHQQSDAKGGREGAKQLEGTES